MRRNPRSPIGLCVVRALRVAPILGGCLLAFGASDSALGHDCGAPGSRAGYGTGYGYDFHGGARSTLRSRTGSGYGASRLYRHRSGYLHGGGPGGPGWGYGTPGYDVRREFDNRRDRLLDYAREIDVSYVNDQQSYRRDPSLEVENADPGWVLLEQNEPIGAIGRFTARLMTAPTDGDALVGFALSAAMIDDHRAAARAMRMAVEHDVVAVCDLAAGDALRDHLEPLLATYVLRSEGEHAHPDARFMASALHCLLGDDADAIALLDATEVPSIRDRSVAKLRTRIAEVRGLRARLETADTSVESLETADAAEAADVDAAGTTG